MKTLNPNSKVCSTKSSNSHRAFSRQCAGPWWILPFLILAIWIGSSGDVSATETPLQNFVAQTDFVSISGRRVEIKKGSFSFSSAVDAQGTGSSGSTGSSSGGGAERTRTINSLSIRFQPGTAYEKVLVEQTLFGQKIVKKPRGQTAIEIRSIEIRERNRTVALWTGFSVTDSVPLTADNLDHPSASEPNFVRLDDNCRSLRIPMHVGPVVWSDVQISFHLTVRLGDSTSAIPDISDGGQRTLLWRPALYQIDLEGPITPGRPPRPAELRARGAGLLATPDNPLVGDTFSAVMILQNVGEVSSETQPFTWTYGNSSLAGELPPVPAGGTKKIDFAARALLDEEDIHLQMGSVIYNSEMRPLKRPKLSLVSVIAAERFSEEPLEALFVVSNSGSGDAKQPLLTLRYDGSETVLHLPEIHPGEKIASRVIWTDTFPLEFTLTATLRDETENESTVNVAVVRKPRPRSKFEIVSMRFDGATEPSGESPDESMRLMGEASRFRVKIRNAGDMPGAAGVRLEVSAVATGEIFAVRELQKDIAPGKTADFVTENFALDGGLIRGSVALDAIREFAQIDVSPTPEVIAEGDVLLAPGSSSVSMRLNHVEPLDRAVTYEFFPLSSPEEIQPHVVMAIPTRTWNSAARNSTIKPAVRVTLRSGGLDDRFDISSTETTVFYSLPRSALEDTLTVTLVQQGSSRSFLTLPPSIRLPLAADENGRILEANATDSGMYVKVENRATRIDAAHVTIEYGYSKQELATILVPLAKGESEIIFLPIARGSAGHHMIQASTSRSPEKNPIVVKQFIAPDPFPRIEISSVLSGRLLAPLSQPLLPQDADGHQRYAGVDATLVLVSVMDHDAPDLSIQLDNHLSLPMALVPGNETAVYVMNAPDLPGGDSVLLDYGVVKLEHRIPAQLHDIERYHLRLIDLGELALGDPVPRNPVARFIRYADSSALPAGTIFLAINGLLTRAVSVPSLAVGEKYIGSIRFTAPSSGEADIVLYEIVPPPRPGRLLAISDPLGHFIGSQIVVAGTPSAREAGSGKREGPAPWVPAPESRPLGPASPGLEEHHVPARGDWDWTTPVIFTSPQRPAPDQNGSVYLRAGELAMKATEILIRGEAGTSGSVGGTPGGQNHPTGALNHPVSMISPQTARDLDRLAADTATLARIEYRDKLQSFIAEWNVAIIALSGLPLPATLEPSNVSELHATLASLSRLADEPSAIDHQIVENEMRKFISSIEIFLGRRVGDAYHTM